MRVIIWTRGRWTSLSDYTQEKMDASLSYYTQKKSHEKGQTDTQTYIQRTSRFYDRISPVGQFDENVLHGIS